MLQGRPNARQRGWGVPCKHLFSYPDRLNQFTEKYYRFCTFFHNVFRLARQRTSKHWFETKLFCDGICERSKTNIFKHLFWLCKITPVNTLFKFYCCATVLLSAMLRSIFSKPAVWLARQRTSKQIFETEYFATKILCAMLQSIFMNPSFWTRL